MANPNTSGIRVNIGADGVSFTVALLGNLRERMAGYVYDVLGKSTKIAEKIARNRIIALSSKGRNSSILKDQGKEPITTSDWKHPKNNPFLSSIRTLGGEFLPISQTMQIRLNLYSHEQLLWRYFFGTPEHDIYPSKKKFLMFYWEKVDALVVFAHVHHLGAKSHPELLTYIRSHTSTEIKKYANRVKSSFSNNSRYSDVSRFSGYAESLGLSHRNL